MAERQGSREELKQDLKDAGYKPGPGAPNGDVGYYDRRENVYDRREDVRDSREDVRDAKEDVWDAQHEGGKADKLEDVRDAKEDVRDAKEDVRDRREDVRDVKENGPGPRPDGPRNADQKENVIDRRENVRDRNENVRDRHENVRDRREDVRDAKHQGGKRDQIEDVRDRREDVLAMRNNRLRLALERRQLADGRRIFHLPDASAVAADADDRLAVGSERGAAHWGGCFRIAREHPPRRRVEHFGRLVATGRGDQRAIGAVRNVGHPISVIADLEPLGAGGDVEDANRTVGPRRRTVANDKMNRGVACVRFLTPARCNPMSVTNDIKEPASVPRRLIHIQHQKSPENHDRLQ